MTADLILYSNPMSRGRIARWMLEEVGEPYRVEYLDYRSTMKSPDFLALNPMGKVPVVKHGDNVVSEGAAICAYLAAAFPQAGLMPAPGTPESAAFYRWLFFAAGPVEAAVTAKSLGLLAPPEKAAFVGYGSYEATIDALETATKANRYIAGDRFTAADVYVGAQIGWGMRFGTIDPRPSFTAYWERLETRDAYRRAAAADDAALPAQE